MLRLIVFSLSWACLFAFTKSSLCHYGRCEHADDIFVLLHANHLSEDEYNEFSTLSYTIHRRSLLASSAMILLPAFAAADDEQVIAIILDGESQCKDGKIASESAVPGAYQQICMSMDQRSFTMKSSGDIITIVQGANSGGGSVAGRTGVAVWNSGILLTRLLDKINSIDSSIFKGKTVLELGCGAGLASIALAKFDAVSVLATDANEEVLRLAQQNFELNNVTNVKTVALRWGMLHASEYDSVADIVVGSDLTYNSGSWLSLAETMATVLKQDGIVLYLTLGHSGFNAQAELQGFLQVAENAGLQVIQEEQIFGENLSDILGRITSSDEKQLINANGGAKAIVLQRKGNKKYR